MTTTTGISRLVEAELPVCGEHMARYRGSLLAVLGPTADTCVHCSRDWDWRWRRLLARNGWLGRVREDDLIYISGPMSGMADLNRPAFRMMEHALKLRGAKVLSPAGADQALTYELLLKQGLAMVLESKTMVMLKNWEQSNGAVAEFTLGQLLGHKIFKEI